MEIHGRYFGIQTQSHVNGSKRNCGPYYDSAPNLIDTQASQLSDERSECSIAFAHDWTNSTIIMNCRSGQNHHRSQVFDNGTAAVSRWLAFTRI